MVKFVKAEEMEWEQPNKNIYCKIVTGKKSTLMLVHLDIGTTMDPHNHEEEQLGYVIEGKFEFIVGPNHVSHIVEAGDFYFFDSNEIHGIRNTLKKTILVDLFAPARKDYLHLAKSMYEWHN